MTAKLAKRADEIAAKFREPAENWEVLRDYVDLKTGGELDCIQLDLLTDMVAQRIKRGQN